MDLEEYKSRPITYKYVKGYKGDGLVKIENNKVKINMEVAKTKFKESYPNYGDRQFKYFMGGYYKNIADFLNIEQCKKCKYCGVIDHVSALDQKVMHSNYMCEKNNKDMLQYIKEYIFGKQEEDNIKICTIKRHPCKYIPNNSQMTNDMKEYIDFE